jgi:hypothetical protein
MAEDEAPAAAELTEEEDAGGPSSGPEEGAREPEMEDPGHHSSSPEEGALGAGAAPGQQPPETGKAPNWDRVLIVLQLVAGVALVVFGAVLAALTKEATHDIGTAVIGVGAALLPAGAAASATARITRGQ